MPEPERCVVCKQRITMRGWEPFCCEVCWDSADADEVRELERRGDDWAGGRETGRTARPDTISEVM